jgi:hypothetical protein
MLLWVVASSTAAEQNHAQTDSENGSAEVLPLGRFYFFVDPVGLITLGPRVEGGVRILPHSFLGVHCRLSGLGLMTHVLEGGFSTDIRISPFSVAPGITATQVFFGRSPFNCFYCGLLGGMALTGSSGDFGTPAEWKGLSGGVVSELFFGYRWRRPSGGFLSLGLRIGAVIGVWDEWWFIDMPDYPISQSPSVYPVGDLEIALGYEILLRRFRATP